VKRGYPRPTTDWADLEAEALEVVLTQGSNDHVAGLGRFIEWKENEDGEQRLVFANAALAASLDELVGDEQARARAALMLFDMIEDDLLDIFRSHSLSVDTERAVLDALWLARCEW
jgi:hypothetical protein